MLDGVRKEVGVDEDGVWWAQGGIVLEEEGGRDLRDLADDVWLFGLLLFFLLEDLVLFQTGISLADEAFDLGIVCVRRCEIDYDGWYIPEQTCVSSLHATLLVCVE